uniref:Uncharacterized protein n=1 Tax=Arundo donax TaxID=35708 RepID=A0A0A9DSF7_ARUDO
MHHLAQFSVPTVFYFHYGIALSLEFLQLKISGRLIFSHETFQPNANSSQQQTADHLGNQQMILASHEKQVEMIWMNMPGYV